MTLAILLGLWSALAYGVSDLIAPAAARRVGVRRLMLYGQGSTFLILTVFVLIRQPEGTASARSWGAALAANLMCLGATALLYRGLQVGRVAVVVPIMASYGAVTALAALAAGEVFPATTLAGLVLVVAGAAASAVPAEQEEPRSEAHPESGALYGAGSAIGYGIGFWAQGEYVVPELGPALTSWVYYATAFLALLGFSLASRRTIAPPRFRDTPVVFGTSGFAAAG